MSCSDVPLNITTSASKCQLKCLLYYNYGNSSSHITNNETYLSIVYDGKSDVVYGNVSYTPTEIRIYSPSIHTYSGSQADAELIIVHSSAQGGLLICIPIATGSATAGSNLLSTIIESTPSEGSASVNVPDFNANLFIPTSRYYTYSGGLPFDTCTDLVYQYVVFNPADGSLPVNSDTLHSIKALIRNSGIDAVDSGIALFVNDKGTTTNGFGGDGQIYIDCQPTGHSEEEVVFKETASSGPSSDIWISILSVVIGALLVYITFRIMKLVLAYINGESLGLNIKMLG